MQIDLDLFICFAAVAEEMSFRKAAQKLGKDQSWLSRRVRKLEEYVGTSLFERNTRHVALTADGRALLQHARGFAETAQRLQGVAREMRHSQVKRLRIGAAAYSAYMPERVELVNAYMMRHPKVEVEVVYGQTFNLLERLRRRDIDVAFVSMPFDKSDFETLFFHANEGGFWLPPDDPLAAREAIAIEDLAGRRVANLPYYVKSKLQELINRRLGEAGAVMIAMPETDRSAIRLYARKQGLLLFSFDGQADLSLRSDDMVYRPMIHSRLRREMWLVRNADNQSSVVDWFWSLTRQHATADKPSIDAFDIPPATMDADGDAAEQHAGEADAAVLSRAV